MHVLSGVDWVKTMTPTEEVCADSTSLRCQTKDEVRGIVPRQASVSVVSRILVSFDLPISPLTM